MKEKDNKKNILSPRQIEFINQYADIDSDTFGNAYKSAIKAGYTEQTAKRITAQIPDKVNQKISECLEPEKIKEKVISKLIKIIDALEDAGLRAKMDLSSDNVLKSLELLGKWQKLFTDKVEVSGGIQVIGYLPGEQGYQQG